MYALTDESRLYQPPVECRLAIVKPPAKAPTLEETGKRRRGRSIKPDPQSQSIDPPPPPPPRSDSVQASAGDSADVSGYFEVLGISPGASPKEVQTAYRNSALRTHPDKGGSAEKQSTAVGSLIQQCGVRSEKRAMQATLPCAATATDPFRQVELPCVECGCQEDGAWPNSTGDV